MATRDPRIDAYIEAAPEHARPVLEELRRRVHDACPDVVETIKWRAPAFEAGGFLSGMAAFQKHCSFVFWQEKLLLAADEETREVVQALGRISGPKDLPGKAPMRRVLKRAVALLAAGAKVPKAAKARPPIEAHPEFTAALAKNRAAARQFSGFAPSQQREYHEWITTAKRDATRAQRIALAVDWIAAGKHRHWKYER
jgi:hypothetical protein